MIRTLRRWRRWLRAGGRWIFDGFAPEVYEVLHEANAEQGTRLPSGGAPGQRFLRTDWGVWFRWEPIRARVRRGIAAVGVLAAALAAGALGGAAVAVVLRALW